MKLWRRKISPKYGDGRDSPGGDWGAEQVKRLIGRGVAEGADELGQANGRPRKGERRGEDWGGSGGDYDLHIRR